MNDSGFSEKVKVEGNTERGQLRVVLLEIGFAKSRAKLLSLDLA